MKVWIWDWLKSTAKVIKETITRKPEIRTMEIDREYIPYGSVAYKDYKTGRFRDTKTGKFISLEQYKEIKSEIAEYNLRQLLSSSKYDYTEQEIEDIIQEYYNLAEVDMEEARALIRTVTETP